MAIKSRMRIGFVNIVVTQILYETDIFGNEAVMNSKNITH